MISTIVLAVLSVASAPPLPPQNGEVALPAQSWEYAPGPRQIHVYVYYPSGRLDRVNAETGLMLCLHNWGGTNAAGAPDPAQVADRYNVIAISVDYLQSGTWDPSAGPPYDFGYLQALDALRALHYVFHSLDVACRPFARGRIYATGGSGGGNVALMANKLAPRTFACVIDISGMAKLSDDIAFGLPGGSDLNAGYSNIPKTIGFLDNDAQELRFVGHPEHLKTMRALGNAATIVVVHGVEDPTCPVEDVREMVRNFRKAGIDTDARLVEKKDLAGGLFKNAGHSLGDRTKILFGVADRYLIPGAPAIRKREGKTDFEFRDDRVRYATDNGEFVISYAEGFPAGTFVERRR